MRKVSCAMRLNSRFISFIARPPIDSSSYSRCLPLVRHTTCKDITNRRRREGPHLAWLAVNGRRYTTCDSLLFSRMLKNPSNLSFRGAAGDEESRTSFVCRARFLASLGMTTFTKVFQHPVRVRHEGRWIIGGLKPAGGRRKPP